MSYILDALRKSERERAVGNVPTLGTPYPRHASLPRLWVWATLAVVVVAAAVAVGYALTPRGATLAPPQAAAPPSPAPAAAPQAEPVAAVPADPQPQSAPPPPAVTELPAPVEAAVPGLTVNVVAYSEDPGRRFVMINLKSYKEGERTAEGALVEQIMPDGAIVSLNGRRVRLHP